MSEILSRDDLIVAVNRLMISAMEDIDCGRNEAGPTTLDLVKRIEDHDAALRLALAAAVEERDEARAAEEWLAFASMREERDALKAERNAALTLAENRGAAYDMMWREVESLRDRLDKEEEERGRQFGLRVQAETEVERLMSLVQAWYEGRARIGAHMTFADQRFYDGVRCQRTGWPGDDASGDGGPPEES